MSFEWPLCGKQNLVCLSYMILDGKWALVTGAAKGIGRGIAIELARVGCNVIVNDFDDAIGAEETVELVRQEGRKASSKLADVSRGDSADLLFDGIETLDILVNNAGVQTWKALLDVREDEWDRVIATNLKGCFLCTQRAAAVMRKSGRAADALSISGRGATGLDFHG